jgi:acetyl-CoA C-acetyltransferase
VESHKRAAKAWEEGRFANSVAPVNDILGIPLLSRDETIRVDATMQSLGALNPSFADMGKAYGFDGVALQKYPEFERINHVHTPGNSSGIVDGAATVLIGTKEAGEKAGLKPRARIKSFASIGSEPTIMLTGPSFAAERALAKAGMKKEDVDLWEVNEAFSSIVLRFMDALNVPHDKINVNGGAIAMGHPLGATGAMVLGILVDEMERRGVETGLVALCIGAGMGTATILERV